MKNYDFFNELDGGNNQNGHMNFHDPPSITPNNTMNLLDNEDFVTMPT